MSKDNKGVTAKIGEQVTTEAEVVNEETLFEPKEEVEMEMEISAEEASEEIVEDVSSEAGEDNGMEFELGSEDEMKELETIVGDKVNAEKASDDKDKGKRGPKGPRNTEGGSEVAAKPKEKVDLKSIRVMEREIKRGNVVCPQGRMEKTDDGKYKMLLAPNLSVRTEDLVFEEVGIIEKLNDGKWELSCIAAEKFGSRFKISLDGKSVIEEGEGIFHNFVRVELHKPGRDKDVVEAYTIDWAKGKQKEVNSKRLKRETEKAKEEVKEEVQTEATA